MRAALLAEDPGAAVLPYCLSGGTDNKALSLLGITGYGFAPLRLTPDLDFPAMFHGVDERVPVSALKFGARVLGRFLMERLFDWAKAKGVRKVVGQVLSDNAPMLAFVRRLGFSVRRSPGEEDVMVAEREIA